MSALIAELDPFSAPWRIGGELADLIRERSSERVGQAYVEHAREDRRLSYRELLGRVEDWAASLDEAGVAPGSTVGLVVADPIAFSIGFLGTIAAGRWAAPLDPNTPERGMDLAIARVGADTVFSDQPAPGGLAVDWFELDDAAIRVCDEVVPQSGGSSLDASSGGAVLASSGTTGVPKVVSLHQSRLLYTARNVCDHHRLTSSDRGFNSLPLFHINAEVVGLLATLVAGSTLVLDDRFHRTRFWAVMADRRITWINAVPAIISRLADPGADEVIPSRIRFIRSASAPLPVATSTRFEASTGIPVVETYGMTEAGSQITANPVDGVRKQGSVGLPVGVEVRVVVGEEEATAARPGHLQGNNVGQVEIRGPSVISAYAGRVHGDRIDDEGWLRTGDLGHFDEDGYLYLDSRTDDVINRGGEKVFPREIEEAVLADPDVYAVAVVGAPDPELGQVPVAYLVLQGVSDEGDGARAAEVTDRIRDHLSSALVRSKRPASLFVVGALPAGATGKVQRRSLHDDDLPVIYRLDYR